MECRAETEDLGNGFFHHGVATPVSNHRGTVATADGEGRDVVLLWLFDHRGGYALLMIDADTGKSEEIPMPFPPGGDCPYASILSSGNRFYTHFNSHFVEFDPAKRAFTFCSKTAPQMAMGMTEDDNGVIWSVTYPQSGVVSFNPETREFRDYGHVYKQNWRQYQRHVAADDAGWIYFGIGSTAGQIIAFNPESGKGTPVVPDEERVQGTGSVFRDVNGKVYGNDGGGQWYELYRGQARKLEKEPEWKAKPVITGSQGLFHRKFPDGRVLKTCDLVNRNLTVVDPKTEEEKTVEFDYTSEGAHIMGVAAAPDGTVCGGTAFPMRFFSYNPQTDEWINREAYGQWNTVARQGSHFFVGGYGHGFLLDWNPSAPWVRTVAATAPTSTIGWGYSSERYYHFNGTIDDVRIYNRALSQEEIQSPPAEGLAAHWSFDEGEGSAAKDAAGQAEDSHVHGAHWVDGKFGKALQFDGTGDYVEVSEATGIYPQHAMTISAWIHPTPPHQRGFGGLLNNIAGHRNSRLLVLSSGRILAQVVIGGKKRDVWGPPVKNNEWNHVVYVYDGSDEYWVVNGKPGKKYPATGELRTLSNPRFLTQCHPTINRPHDLLAHPDGHTLVLAGTPGYGYTGGGLLFWDRDTQKAVVLTHEQLIPLQSTMSLAALPGRKLLGGTTIAAGTGGEIKAKEAELYILDMGTHKVEWHEVVFPGVRNYTDLCSGPESLVYGIADQRLFFVFDSTRRKIIYKKDVAADFGSTTSQQGPRVFVKSPGGDIYLLFVQGIARLDPETYEIRLLAESPVPIGPGGDYVDGRIYFGRGSHLYSYKLPEERR